MYCMSKKRSLCMPRPFKHAKKSQLRMPIKEESLSSMPCILCLLGNMPRRASGISTSFRTYKGLPPNRTPIIYIFATKIWINADYLAKCTWSHGHYYGPWDLKPLEPLVCLALNHVEARSKVRSPQSGGLSLLSKPPLNQCRLVQPCDTKTAASIVEVTNSHVLYQG